MNPRSALNSERYPPIARCSAGRHEPAFGVEQRAIPPDRPLDVLLGDRKSQFLRRQQSAAMEALVAGGRIVLVVGQDVVIGLPSLGIRRARQRRRDVQAVFLIVADEFISPPDESLVHLAAGAFHQHGPNEVIVRVVLVVHPRPEDGAIGLDRLLRVVEPQGGVEPVADPLFPAVARAGDEDVPSVAGPVVRVTRKIPAEQKERRVAQDGFHDRVVPALAVGDRQVRRDLSVVMVAGRAGEDPGRETPRLARSQRLPAVHLILVRVPRVLGRLDDQRVGIAAVAGQDREPMGGRIQEDLAAVFPQSRRVGDEAEDRFARADHHHGEGLRPGRASHRVVQRASRFGPGKRGELAVQGQIEPKGDRKPLRRFRTHLQRALHQRGSLLFEAKPHGQSGDPGRAQLDDAAVDRLCPKQDRLGRRSRQQQFHAGRRGR